MSSDTPQHEEYEEMQDTPWITQGREIASAGGQGILDNYNNVNVFDEDTQKSLEARNNATYKRAYDNMQEQYDKIMNQYAANNYNQFGTLNATPAAYRTSQAQKDYLQQLDDLAYNQATNYDTLMDNELNRRYKTLAMYEDMYNYGQTPYEQDVSNWNTRNTNKDIAYQNAVARANSGNSLGSTLGTMLGAAAGTLISPGIGTSLGSALGSYVGGTV